MSIHTLPGIGPAACNVLDAAGFETLDKIIYNFDPLVDHLKIRRGINKVLDGPYAGPGSVEYEHALRRRCLDIVYNVKNGTRHYIPHEFMCPLSLDWYHDPVVTPDGYSFSKDEILRHLSSCSCRRNSTTSPEKLDRPPKIPCAP